VKAGWNSALISFAGARGVAVERIDRGHRQQFGRGQIGVLRSQGAEAAQSRGNQKRSGHCREVWMIDRIIT
jgi:hypothetical protein